MTVSQILSICGGISIVGGALTVMVHFIKPIITITKKVDTMERTDAEVLKRLEAVEKTQKQQTKCLAAMLNHMITGNGVEHMKEIRDELLESVINSK